MLAFIFKRILGLLATLLLASLIIFGIMNVLPGDPAQIMLGTGATPETIAALKAELGLDQPFWTRYRDWIVGLVTGAGTISFTYRVPVADLIGERIIVSLPLALLALILTFLFAIPAGLYSAAMHHRWSDRVLSICAQIGLAIPNFCLALLLIMVFAIHLQWLPAGGFPGWGAGLWPAFQALILPAVALAFSQVAILQRLTRAAALDVLGQPYIRTARAKGVATRHILSRHVWRNAMIPLITLIGLQFSFLVAGAIIIEYVFHLPGLGRLLFQAIAQRDLILVQNLVMVLVALVIVVNFLVDLMARMVNPRIRRPT